MKLILLQDVKNVGKKNQTIDVKDGYGNFLINSGKAITSTVKSQEIVNKQVAVAKKEYDIEVEQATLIKKQIESTKLEFTLKTNNGVAFGSISNKQIIDALAKEYSIKIDKFMIVDSPNSYGLGRHNITIKLHKDVKACLTFNVSGE